MTALEDDDAQEIRGLRELLTQPSVLDRGAACSWTWSIEPACHIGYLVTFHCPHDDYSRKGGIPLAEYPRRFVAGSQRRAVRIARRGVARRTRRDDRKARLSIGGAS